MAEKFIQVMSTRTTRIGTFRHGMIYKLDDSDLRVAAVIKNLTDEGSKEAPKTPAAKLLTKAQAQKAKAAVKSVEVSEDPKDAQAKMVQKAVDEAVAEAGQKHAALEKSLAAEKAAREKAEAELKELNSAK